MILSHRVYERLPHRLRWLIAPHVRYAVFGRPIILPRPRGNGMPISQIAAWKHHALATLVPMTEGAFLDIGTNLGQTLVEFMSTGIRRPYVGFEPNPACVAYVESIIEANGYADCTVVPIGLGERAGVVALYHRHGEGDRTDAAATLIRDLRPRRDLHATFVSVHPFDATRPTLPIERVGFVKIDVEGVEADTVAGMIETLRSDRPLVMCEVLGADAAADITAWAARAARLQSTLGAADYVIARIDKSADVTRVVGFTPMAGFPVEVWTPEREECYDYLFIPRERAPEVLAVRP